MEETFTYDNYIQDPTSQQGFNRYAYCVYNPLKYVYPSGESRFGMSEAEMQRMYDEIAEQAVYHEWTRICMQSDLELERTIAMACTLYGHGEGGHRGHDNSGVGGEKDENGNMKPDENKPVSYGGNGGNKSGNKKRIYCQRFLQQYGIARRSCNAVILTGVDACGGVDWICNKIFKP